jgi:hypothetical protein
MVFALYLVLIASTLSVGTKIRPLRDCSSSYP